MLRRHRQYRTKIHQIVDAGLFALGFYLAHWIRSHWAFSLNIRGWNLLGDPIRPFSEYLVLYLAILPMAPLILQAQGFYTRPFLFSRRLTAWSLAKSCFFTMIGVVLMLFLLKGEGARGVVIFFGLISFVLVYTKEETLRLVGNSKLGQSQGKKRVVLVGLKEETGKLAQEIKRQSSNEIIVVLEMDLNETSLDDFVQVLHEHSINGVILNAAHIFFGQIEKVIQACELEGVEAWLVADFFKTQVSRTSVDDFYGRPVLVFHSGPEASWEGVVKQLVDFIGAVFLLIVLAPVLAFAALAIRMSSPGPVLFRQLRSGLNGHPFTMYKFRSMVTDAEQLKQELAALNEMTGPVFKIANDPRITPVGRLLRKYSIDELPQLFNVLRMEMSLVGPRPLPVEEVKRFDDLSHRRRLSVRPGLTCLWQISGRNQVNDFRDWVRLDLEYIDNWSLWLDLKILCRTIPVVLFAKGAR